VKKGRAAKHALLASVFTSFTTTHYNNRLQQLAYNKSLHQLGHGVDTVILSEASGSRSEADAQPKCLP
jgi:hypothetical protein